MSSILISTADSSRAPPKRQGFAYGVGLESPEGYSLAAGLASPLPCRSVPFPDRRPQRWDKLAEPSPPRCRTNLGRTN